MGVSPPLSSIARARLDLAHARPPHTFHPPRAAKLASTGGDDGGEHSGVAAHDLRAVSARLTEQIEARLLRTRVVGGGKAAVYAGGDVVLEQANSIFGFCWWSDEVRGQKVIHLTS